MRILPARCARVFCGLAVALAMAPWARAQDPAPDTLAVEAPADAPAGGKPLAVLAISSYDELKQDADFLGGLLGQPQISQSLEAMLQGTPGLDRTKPLGLLVTQYGMPPTFAACIPVTDMDAFMGGLKPLNVTTQEGPDGTIQISAMGQTLVAKHVNGWALVTMAPQMLESMPADPGAEFGELTKEYDLALRINMQSVPAEVRQQLTGIMASVAQAGLNKRPDESDEEFADRRKQMDAQLERQKRVFNEIDQLTFGVGVDRAGQRALMDVVYTAVAGSQLAQQLGSYKDTTTNYAGFLQEGAALTFGFAAKTTDIEAAELDDMVDGLRVQANQGIAEEAGLKSDEARETMKAAIGDFIEALRGTLHAGAIDGGAVLHVSPEALTLVAGGAIAEPAKVEDGLKKLEEVAKSEEIDMPEIKWNAQTYQDIQFHVMTKSMADQDEDAKALFGDNLEMAFGIGKQSVYFAMGKNWLDAVKKTVDDSAANLNKSVRPMELTVTATPIVQTMAAHADEDEKQTFEMVANALGQSAGRDHARMVAEPIENGVRTRFEVEDGLLRAVGAGVMAARMQQMQAAQAPAAAVEEAPAEQ